MQVKTDYQLAKAAYERDSEALESVEGNIKLIKKEATLRRAKFKELRQDYSEQVDARFSDILTEHAAAGRIDFDMDPASDEGSVTMRVLFNAASKLSLTEGTQVDESVLQTSESLSGGEKTTAGLAFLMAAARVVSEQSRGLFWMFGLSDSFAGRGEGAWHLPAGLVPLQRCQCAAWTNSTSTWTTRRARCATEGAMNPLSTVAPPAPLNLLSSPCFSELWTWF